MLGHLKPHTCSLPSASQRAYRNYYCSICASLRKQNNVFYTFFINNELTLVLLALQPYFQSQAKNKKEAQTHCPAQVFTKKKSISQHPAIETAAKLSVLLGWIKVTDWAYDQPHFFKGTLCKHLNRKVAPLLELLGPDFQQTIADYWQITQVNTPAFEQLLKESGELSYQMTCVVGQKTSISSNKLQKIAELFRWCGRLILLTDHLVDLTQDIAKKQYNPIITNQKHLSGWDEAYYTIRRQFNRENLKIKDLLQQLLESKVIHSNFAQAFRAALYQMEYKVIQHKPDFIAQQFVFEGEGSVVVKNDCGDSECCGEESCCGSGGCCDCSGISCCDCCSGNSNIDDGGGDNVDIYDPGDAFDGDSSSQKKKKEEEKKSENKDSLRW